MVRTMQVSEDAWRRGCFVVGLPHRKFLSSDARNVEPPERSRSGLPNDAVD